MSPAAKSAARAMSSLDQANAVEAVNIRLSRELLDLVDRHSAARVVTRSVVVTDLLNRRIATNAKALRVPLVDNEPVSVKLSLPTVVLDVIRARAKRNRRSLTAELHFLLGLATDEERANAAKYPRR